MFVTSFIAEYARGLLRCGDVATSLRRNVR